MLDVLLGLGVFVLSWRGLRSLRLPHSWTLGGAVLIAAVLYPLLISLLLTMLRGLTSLPLWGVIPLLFVILLAGLGGYWLGHLQFPLDPVPPERLRRG